MKQFMNNTFTKLSSQQFHHNLWNSLWTILSQQFHHNNFITTYESQFMNNTSTHFHKLHRKIYFNTHFILHLTILHRILHYNNEWQIFHHKHFNNASWFFIINLHDNKWVTFFDKHLMIYTQILFAKFHSTIKWQTFIQQLSDKLSFANFHSTIIVTNFHSQTFIQQL